MWSDKSPTQLGFYWWKIDQLSEPRLVKVTGPDSFYDRTEKQFRALSDFKNNKKFNAQWFGPLKTENDKPPALPTPTKG